MLTNEGKIVFFEGNFAGARAPRQMFINYGNFKDFVTYFFWPFDQDYCVTPTNTHRGLVNKTKGE
jgi:hypothetical protein